MGRGDAHLLSDRSDRENMAKGRHGAHRNGEESGKRQAHILSDGMGTIPYKVTAVADSSGCSSPSKV